ncbi:hypothetical protein BDQ12DRAFT_170059 [Crucibulum laeve]|uniref:Cyclin-domain-containing protein n=1 Tax=Crucibulum laeve TaxID=68775 RepID=A0A5C3MF26_9AGAR|nr:hypothetical protein BDQ12DRAFT_170059 [Crucibulum laeve]
MPVPVPRFTKPTAHPVIKHINCDNTHSIQSHNLTHTLPVSPTGPPPSFGTREEWINSLPAWRRTKPRRIWEDDTTHLADQQDFSQGLTAAANAPVIKGVRAQACIPPQYNIYEQVPPVQSLDGLPSPNDDADDEMSDYSARGYSQYGNDKQWDDNSHIGHVQDSSEAMLVDDRSTSHAMDSSPMDAPSYSDHSYERGAFTPIFEDQSPGVASGPDGSSPLGPLTPLSEFVDRAVATEQHPYTSYNGQYDNALPAAEYAYSGKDSGVHYHEPPVAYPTIAEQPKEQASAVSEIATPSATTGYKKLAEPLSEWVASYVWKVCTTGFSLPPMFVRGSNALAPYSNSPPRYLSSAVHSLLLSTLLQPSAVFLAVWYIVRLPAYFGAAALGVELVKEMRFRTALLGDAHAGFERDTLEGAPFRLIVLGCMLANKWLDDHTFSNKTWHTISNVPIHVLNKLESLTLDIFSYDLSISSLQWSQWLGHVMSYHMSLTSPIHPQPISRPSANPHSIVRKSIEELIQAPTPVDSSICDVPQPVFLGLEERKRERMEKEQATAEALDIDLDEDGPLREEYLPRRRISAATSLRASRSHEAAAVTQSNIENVQEWNKRVEIAKPLPPPAKWSPAGDEPILRERNRVSGQYLAVQAPLVSNNYPMAYHQTHDAAYNQNWNPAGNHLPIKQQQQPYIYNVPAPVHVTQPAYNPYVGIGFAQQSYAVPHNRSQSLSYDQDTLQQSRSHARSYSQAQFEYRCSNIRMTANELAPPQETNPHWVDAGQYPYRTAFWPLSGMDYQAAWLRT